ncbi:MAG: putative toxin-antitoxin system toxin component, PIN family [Pirellulales bacterium]
MRIVLDTNILARATPGKSGPAAAVREAIRPPHLLVLSSHLLTELAEVLRYERVRRLHGLTEGEIEFFVDALRLDALIVEVELPAITAIVPNDPDDDPIVATAVVGRAEYLCSLDRHLFRPEVQAHCAQRGVRVVTDVELLALLRSQQNP